MSIGKKEEDPHRYDDMLDLPHPRSDKHPQMKLLDRAAQFAPFAALSGYGEAVEDTEKKAFDRLLEEEAGVIFEESP